ncbi:MAG: tetratricopeptide repeat protein [Candidatus Omnitrophota bacterium]
MNKKIKYIVIMLIFAFLLLWGYSQYSAKLNKPKLTYHTKHETKNSTMLIGGMAKDKDKIDAFKNSLEEGNFRNFWDNLHLSSDCKKKGDYENAILYSKKALECAQGKGDEFQARMGLARLYKETKQYDLAIKEYEWCINYSNRPDVIEQLKSEIKNIKRNKGVSPRN